MYNRTFSIQGVTTRYAGQCVKRCPRYGKKSCSIAKNLSLSASRFFYSFFIPLPILLLPFPFQPLPPPPQTSVCLSPPQMGAAGPTAVGRDQ